MNKEHSTYLENLRLSGVTNMFGAVPYLMEHFGITQKQASAILAQWMRTYSRPAANSQ